MLYIDKMPVTHGKFPNNEVYIDFDELHTLDRATPHEVLCKFESNDDLVSLMLLKRSMDDLGFQNVSLFMPYLPYSALDRTENKRCLGAKYMVEFINALHFNGVRTWEAHSNVSLATTNQITDRLTSLDIATHVMNELITGGTASESDILFVYPDAGAKSRYKSWTPANYLVLEKSRRFQDGRLAEPRVAEAHYESVPHYAIIIDDLCRGGRTVCAAAKVIKELGVETVLFCVAHTEDTVYTGPILDDPNVDIIYTTDSCLTHISHEKLRIVKEVIDS